MELISIVYNQKAQLIPLLALLKNQMDVNTLHWSTLHKKAQAKISPMSTANLLIRHRLVVQYKSGYSVACS